jgi:hypothetical protein
MKTTYDKTLIKQMQTAGIASEVIERANQAFIGSRLSGSFLNGMQQLTTNNLTTKTMTTKLTQNQMIAKILNKAYEVLRPELGIGIYGLMVNTFVLLLKEIDEEKRILTKSPSAKQLLELIRDIENCKIDKDRLNSYYHPEYHVKNALLAALTGKDYVVVIDHLAYAYKYALQKEYDRMQNESINQ